MKILELECANKNRYIAYPDKWESLFDINFKDDFPQLHQKILLERNKALTEIDPTWKRIRKITSTEDIKAIISNAALEAVIE